MLEPNYSTQASAALDKLERDDDPDLLNAVCDTIDLICDHLGDRRARSEQLRTAAGTPIWKISIRTRHDDWVLLWWPRDTFADIYYIGPL